MNNQQPIFSIVTPCFKQIDWLRLCVASVRDQIDVVSDEMQNRECEMGNTISESNCSGNERVSHPKSIIPPLAVEHIIQDAGSPGIEEFAREAGANFYRDAKLIFHSAPQNPNYSLSIYSERDRGMYDAINRGLLRAAGKICAYLNCDEQYLERTLPVVAGYFERKPKAEVLFGDALLVDPSGRALSYRRIVRPFRMHTRLEHLCTLSCAMFLRRSVVEHSDGLFPTEYRAIGDAVFVDKLLARGSRMDCLNLPLAAYTFTGSNLSAGKLAEQEGKKWQKLGPYPRCFRGPCVLMHRLRRMLGGAYKKRNMRYALYVSGQPQRKHWSISNLGHSWPREGALNSNEK